MGIKSSTGKTKNKGKDMQERVKIFFSRESLKSLEKDINLFLASTNATFVSIEYDTILATDEWGTGVLLTYIPEVENEKKERKKQS